MAVFETVFSSWMHCFSYGFLMVVEVTILGSWNTLSLVFNGLSKWQYSAAGIRCCQRFSMVVEVAVFCSWNTFLLVFFNGYQSSSIQTLGFSQWFSMIFSHFQHFFNGCRSGSTRQLEHIIIGFHWVIEVAVLGNGTKKLGSIIISKERCLYQ